MADYGKLLSRIWSDSEFVELDAQAQQLYCLLISYSTRNLAGVLPLTLKRWANATKGATVESVTDAMQRLAERRFVVVDWNTEEVLVRTYIRNAGKSSVPADAAVVDDVAADAIRWAQAMQTVAAQRAIEREQARGRHNHFLARWNNWTYTHLGETKTIPLPAAWQHSLDQFLDAGLTMEDLEDLIEIAMTATTRDEWKYFCGCCWRRITELQERARGIVTATPGLTSGPDSPLVSQWTKAEVDQYVALAVSIAEHTLTREAIDFAYCQHLAPGQGNCGDPICRVLWAQDLHGMADASLRQSLREDAVMEEAEALLDG